MRGLVILAIRAYQRFVSPHKGFVCAYRVHTGRCSCSELGRRVVQRKGVFTGLLLLDARLQRCGDISRNRSKSLHPQQGVIHCDLPDLSGCDCGGDACSGGCGGLDGCDGCDGCDWRRRRKTRERNIVIRPSSSLTRPR